MDTKVKYGLIALLLIALGFGAGKYSNPAKIITKTQTQEVIKYVEAKQENKNVIITTKKTIQKDGTVVEESKIEDKSITKTDISLDSKKESKTEVTTIRDSGLTVQALAIKDLDKLSDKPEYGIYIKKRVFSAVSVGALVTTDKKIGVGIGWDF